MESSFTDFCLEFEKYLVDKYVNKNSAYPKQAINYDHIFDAAKNYLKDFYIWDFESLDQDMIKIVVGNLFSL